MSFRSVRDAQQAVWPRIRESLDRHRLSRDAIKAADPRTVTTAALARARKPWSRVVAEEAVWAVAKEDLLATEQHAAVIKAAREWAASWANQGAPSVADGDDPCDVVLYAAVQNLATQFDPPADEDLPNEVLSAIVFPSDAAASSH